MVFLPLTKFSFTRQHLAHRPSPIGKEVGRGSIFALALLSFAPSPAHAALNIPITVNLSETVNVTGVPRIAVDVGGTTRYATYTSGTGSTALTFTLSPQIGDVDLDGVTVSSPIDLNGGTIKDSKGNNATLTFTPPNTANVKVNYPSLGLDFIYDSDGRYTLNGTVYNDLTSFLTATGGSFTRASVGTYFDSTGVMQTAASGTPRFDYDPVTHTAKGILIEESRTNLAFYSKSPVSWATNSATVATTGTTELGMFSSATVSSTGATWNRINMIRTGGTPWVPVTGPVTMTFYYKAGTSGKVAVTVYDTTSSQTTQMAGNVGSLSIISQTAGVISNLTQKQIGSIYVVSATFTPNSTTDNIAFGIGPNSGVSGENIIVLGGQLEYGSFPTSFIPTTNATVTRAIDSLSIPIGAWGDPLKGSFYVEAPKVLNQGVSSRYYALINGNAQVSLINGANIGGYVTDSAGTSIASFNSTALTTGTVFKDGLAYTTNDFAESVNGGTLMTDTTGTMSSLATLIVGNNSAAGSRNINGNISKLKYYPLRLPNSQLQLLTQ